jgi:hypothetical protein
MVAPVPAHISKLPPRKLSCSSRRSTPNSCRLILLQTLLHSQSRQPLWNQVNPNSFAKTPEVGVPRFPFQSPTAHYPPLTTHSPLTTFGMNTCKSVSKQSTLTTFRMNTYEKRGGGGYRDSGFDYPPLATPDSLSVARHMRHAVPQSRAPLNRLLKQIRDSPQNSRSGCLPTFTPSDHQAYRMSLLLVPSYFAELNRFCIPSPIVPVPPPGYTSTSLQEAFP